MHGFKPKKAHAAAAQNFADGGMVRGKGTGTSDEVPAVVPEGTYIMPADSTKALGTKGLASMGAPKVPVNLSNGEFKMPPEQVHAVGVQALDQMKGATHTPVGMPPPAAQAPQQSPKPELFFANGGVVDEDEQRKKPNFFPGNSPDAGANVYGGAGKALGTSGLLATGAENVIAAQPPKPQAPVAQPRPAPPTGAQLDGMVNQIPRDEGLAPAMQPPPASGVQPAAPRASWQNDLASMQAQNVSPQPGAPAAPVPATQVEGWRTKAVMDGAAQDAQAAWDRGGVEGVAGAAGAVTRGAITAVPTAIGEFAYNTAAPLAGAAKGFWNGLTGGSDQPASAPAASGVRGLQAPAASPAPPAAPAPLSQPPAKQPPGQQPQAPAPAGPTEIMPGVFRQGNSYSDSVAGLSGSNTGRPNAQNMAAAQALSDRSERESMGRIMAQQRQAQMVPGGGPVEAGSFTGGYSGVIGGGTGNMRSRTPEQQRRDAAVSASSIDPRTAARGVAALRSLDAMDLQSNQSSSAMDQATMRENGANSRAAMQEAGASQREGGRNALESRRLAAGERRADIETQTAGFGLRQAQRMEALENEYMAAQDDPKKAEAIAQKMRVLSRKNEDRADWGVQVTPATKNADGSTSEGSVVRYNKATGEVDYVGGQQGAQPKPQPKTAAEAVAGQVYQTARGPMRWDGKQFMPL